MEWTVKTNAFTCRRKLCFEKKDLLSVRKLGRMDKGMVPLFRIEAGWRRGREALCPEWRSRIEGRFSIQLERGLFAQESQFAKVVHKFIIEHIFYFIKRDFVELCFGSRTLFILQVFSKHTIQRSLPYRKGGGCVSLILCLLYVSSVSECQINKNKHKENYENG